ncbi:MAG: PaaI family thioesterase [Candidatus Binatia bacterium]|nr:PaaI family thioesterase [Candidatus Binatia bacterium]
MGEANSSTPPFPRPWLQREPGRLIGRGHPAGDFLEAYRWELLEEAPGLLRVRAHLPAHVKNPRGQLFGGFTPTYVDLIALLTVRAGQPRDGWKTWLATTSMRLDYFEPIVGPQFLVESKLVKARGRTRAVETRFYDPEDTLAVFAFTLIREMPLDRPLGDG